MLASHSLWCYGHGNEQDLVAALVSYFLVEGREDLPKSFEQLMER